MGLIGKIKKAKDRLLHVRYDRATGFYRYLRLGKYVYVRSPEDFQREKVFLRHCEGLYFRHYRPEAGDTVVDVGAGYGEEAVYLRARAGGLRYVGVEIQPVIYECLCNTLRGLGGGFSAVPFAITGKPSLRISSQAAYAEVGESEDGYIEVPGLPWADFCLRYGIERVDLLKMNIEGGERDLLDHLKDFDGIRRFVISCHDFRAAAGHGEHLRTKADVVSMLERRGYRVQRFDTGKAWADDWIYAERL